MLFNSIEFVFFFPIVVIAFFAIPHRFRWTLLLAASYYFYAAWRPEYLILIIASTLVDYAAALRMGACDTKRGRRWWLWLSLLSNLGLLFTFKYFNFFNGQLAGLFEFLEVPYRIPELDVLLPVGISFYTFQTLSYTIDVYRGARSPERHLGYFAVYVSFFPQLVAGPIERSRRLLPQFFEKKSFDAARVISGLKLMAWGFFKKLVIADRLAAFVDTVYNNPDGYTGVAVILATVCFAYQIYCDFSGYSDIAIGAAQVMGYDLMTNFKRPYFARSIREFWQRWHISLSTWFRDYLYVPLGGNRTTKWRWYTNLMITFVVSGLWHGANWTFLMWGFLHGFYLFFSIITNRHREWLARVSRLDKWPALHKLIKIAIVFVLVNFAWIFFRANSISDAFLIIRNMFYLDLSVLIIPSPGEVHLEYLIALLSIIFLETAQIVQERKGSVRSFLERQPIWLRWAAYYWLLLMIILLGKFHSVTFIYFQF